MISRVLIRTAVVVLCCLGVTLPICAAPVIVNPGFEEGPAPVFPNYATIPGWEASSHTALPLLSGYTTFYRGGAPFWDNGYNPPYGDPENPTGRVAFLEPYDQSGTGDSTVSIWQEIDGFDVGSQYTVDYWVNGRAHGGIPNMEVLVDDVAMLGPEAITPVNAKGSATQPFVKKSFQFTASSQTHTLKFSASLGSSLDDTLLLDNVSIRPASDLSIPGDANIDGKVDVSDLGILATHYGAVGGATWTEGDFTGDRIVDVSDLGILATNYQQKKAGFPEKLVVLTFDDGNKSDYTFVAPLLQSYGFGATFYVTEGLTFLTDKTAFMTWEEAKELNDAGFEIGNHTGTHPDLRTLNREETVAELEQIEQRFAEYGIDPATTLCYPSYHYTDDAISVLREKGYTFARRGVAPEFPYSGDGDRGPVYNPSVHDPLLVSTTGASGPTWTWEDFLWAIEQSKDGNVAVLTFHGVPATLHPWVNTTQEDFAAYMSYLYENDYTVISLRDLANYIDPSTLPNASEPLASVPEPSVSAMCVFLVFGLVGCLCCRRKQASGLGGYFRYADRIRAR